jgi:hypothetical protein
MSGSGDRRPVPREVADNDVAEHRRYVGAGDADAGNVINERLKVGRPIQTASAETTIRLP